MYKLFLTVRYLRKRRIAYFAVAAVALCVAMVLIVMSVMGGFLEMIKVRARGLLGDIIVDNGRYQGFPLYQEFIDEVLEWPEVIAATPVIYTVGLIRFEETEATHVVTIVGIRLDEIGHVNTFKDGLFYERFYPGTTTLAEQRQPVGGFDFDAEPIRTVDDADNPRDLVIPILPEPYQSALWDSFQRGLTDEDTEKEPISRTLRQAGLPPIVGQIRFRPDVPIMDGDPLPGMIIGLDVIARKKSEGGYARPDVYPRGTKITMTILPVSIGGTADPTPTQAAFRYSDDSRTGIFDIDNKHVYVDFKLLQSLLVMSAETDEETGRRYPGRCSQVQMKITPGVDPIVLAERLEQHFHGFLRRAEFDPLLPAREWRLLNAVTVKTWEQMQAHFIGPVEKERNLMTILFGIISLVAVVLVLCILYMIAMQKTRDIGVIKSVGGSSGGVACIFLLYGAGVGVVGSLLGTALGYFFVRHLNAFQDFIAGINPSWQVWDRSVYSFDQIPDTVFASDILVVALAGMMTSTIGSVAAAWQAGAMQPVEALRYE